jgi:xylulokinase
MLEGIAYNLRWLLPVVEEFDGETFDEIAFSGGGALSDEWSQIVADVIDRPLHQLSDPTHVITRATAFLTFEAIGLAERSGFSKMFPVKRSYEPRPATRETYDRLFDQFLAAFERNRPIFDTLNA